MGPSYTFLPWLVLHAFHASIWRDSRGSRASHWFSSDFRQIDDLVQHLGFDLSAGSAWGINCINCQYLGRQKFELDLHFNFTSLFLVVLSCFKSLPFLSLPLPQVRAETCEDSCEARRSTVWRLRSLAATPPLAGRPWKRADYIRLQVW
jgi:hypothetical protein